jgi:hypothetical protein
MAKRSRRSARRSPARASAAQRILQIFGALIVLSMVLVLLAPLAGGRSRRATPTPLPAEPSPTATLRPLPTATQPSTPTPQVELAPTPDSGG